MTSKVIAGTGHAPTTENSAVVHSIDSKLYITNDSITDSYFTELQHHPLVKEFANVSEELYALVAQTNPTLKLFFDVAKRITEAKE
ncbi:MAG: hypothetical protein A4E23_01643 [Methanomethylovorans sp. PtaU1.Bin073]|jgi:hypothetical protein|nr:MAG: hypothetical protein A4E23_01643 [Methanomethylovorans sp. PtaU1.Bin073]